ncbi:MAG TPA: GFA family protein [Geminicoccus sp.]|uniref:GFA family protein n=1 Tax=Geminicoccus sp. TaxID=2024832 RepID=UPI002BFBC8A6|nr:GFA family protein [Geminicoccus sp.]HWL70917.1 GFA family protein [Geminicoccus sp.]
MTSRDVTGSIRGGCLCGAVRYRVDGPLRAISICHCGQCRRAHGYLGAYSAAAPDRLTVTDTGQLGWYRSSAMAERGFCRQCGSPLFWKPAHGRHISISAGSIDQPSGLVIERHIYVADRADYEVLDPDAPDHWPGGEAP